MHTSNSYLFQNYYTKFVELLSTRYNIDISNTNFVFITPAKEFVFVFGGPQRVFLYFVDNNISSNFLSRCSRCKCGSVTDQFPLQYQSGEESTSFSGNVCMACGNITSESSDLCKKFIQDYKKFYSDNVDRINDMLKYYS